MRLAVRRKNKPNESETKAVSSKCSSLSKAKLQRVIAGTAFVQLIILRFREWDIRRFDLCPIFVSYFQTFYENILKFSVYLI